MNTSEPKIKIFTSYFKPWDIIENDIITPIQCGRATADVKLPMIGDDTGDNISDKNYMYSELTAQYWAWKNDSDYDYIGFMHYRRHFNFSEDALKTVDEYNGDISSSLDDAGMVYHNYYIDDSYKENINMENITKCIDSADIIVANQEETLPNVLKHYSSIHESKDISIIKKIIQDKYPEYYKEFSSLLKDEKISPFNMFIMKKDLFNEYSDFLFTILHEFEIVADLDLRIEYQARACGYIGERLLQLFIKHHDNKKIKYLQRTYINNSLVMNYNYNELIQNNNDTINIALCFNLNYLPHNCVIIKSIMDNANPNDQYNIYCLTRNIDQDCQNNDAMSILEIMIDLEKSFPNLKIICLDITNYKALLFLMPDITHYTVDTFSRLFIPDILPNVEKIIYLDGDVIVCDNLKKMYDIDLTNLAVGAVPELMMKVLLRHNHKILLDGKLLYTVNKFFNKNKLNPDTYFNAGVLLLNLDYIRKNKIQHQWFKMLNKYHPFVDQDILNISFKDKIKIIDTRWNIWAGFMEEQKEIRFRKNLSVKVYRDWQNAINKPGVIHYPGPRKPYDELKPFRKLEIYWWEVAKTAPFYEHFLQRGMNFSASNSNLPAEIHHPVSPLFSIKQYLLLNHPILATILKLPYRMLRLIHHTIQYFKNFK